MSVALGFYSRAHSILIAASLLHLAGEGLQVAHQTALVLAAAALLFPLGHAANLLLARVASDVALLAAFLLLRTSAARSSE